MFKKTIVKPNAYYDSVTLMSLSSKLTEVSGVNEAVVSMGTDMNKDLLKNVNLDTEESEQAKTSDLIIAISAGTEKEYEQALEKIDELLSVNQSEDGERKQKNPKTIKGALEINQEANIVVISVPGEYAAREVEKSLDNDLHVMLFSDNVPIADEKRLKEKAKEKGLLLMGPDCGTASINGTGLCFANEVNRGNIGLVAASGTGLQEVMVQIDRMGGGISQAIGTGGRDLKEEIGGIMMLESIKALEQDDQTEVIVLISKPPAKAVEAEILSYVKKVTKPIIVSFIDGDSSEVEKSGAVFGYNLYDTAKKAVELANNQAINQTKRENHLQTEIEAAKKKIGTKNQYVRALYGGGTLCAESLSILRNKLEHLKSNVANIKDEMLEDVNHYEGHILLDLGEDEFTQGRPHPMIDPTMRMKWIEKEAADEEVGVILLDFELGYGSHEDPVGITIPAIKNAQEIAGNTGREIVFVAYICGTDKDKQNLKLQTKMLKENDIIIANSNAEAATIVAEILT